MKDFWKMARVAVCAAAACVAMSATGQGVTGDWKGVLKINLQMKLKLVMHISDKEVTLDSPDQGAFGIPGEIVYLSDDSVNVRVPGIQAGFAGKLKGDVINGRFEQAGMGFPLKLKREEKKMARPQTPVPPFPYSVDTLSIPTSAGVIAGTLTVPEDAGKKTPLVVMVTGSGPQNRDEELFGHKPFAVIADWLARNGVASFRYDDRGVGGSTGDALSATTADFAADASVAVDYLRKTRRFGRIGILGHSEGGIIAYMLGAKPKTIDFVVSVAGPAIKGSKTVGYQNKASLLKAGIPEKDADDFGNAIAAAFDYKVAHPEAMEITDELLAELYPQYGDSPVTRQLGASIKEAMSQQASNPWMMYFLALDPAQYLKKLKVPALIIYGDNDRQVPPSLNADVARQSAPKATVKVYPGLNHLMQHATTGDVTEYAEIEETISPEVLEAITAFINK